MTMTDNTCNGWRNAATWTVNVWFGDQWAEMQERHIPITAKLCRDMVEEYIEDLIGRNSNSHGFIWDMLDLNSVDWDALEDHYWPVAASA